MRVISKWVLKASFYSAVDIVEKDSLFPRIWVSFQRLLESFNDRCYISYV